MKNTKITKIALIVLSVALLLGTVIGFTVNAAEATEYEILAKNVIYGDRTNVVFAVNATVEEANAGTVKVAYKWGEDGEVKNATLLDTNDVNNLLDKTYPAFAIDGVALKELGNVVYATAYTGDAPAEDAKWVTYSAAEYFYSRLYKDGFVNKTEADGKDNNRKLLYQSMLESGKQAQIVLDYNTDKLVTDYTYVYTTSELINFNGAKTAFGYGELSLTATSELAIAGWTLTDMDGVETTLETVILTANGVYNVEPIFGGHECADVDPADHLCDSCGEKTSDCATADGDHICDLCGKVATKCADGNADNKCDTCGAYTFSVNKIESNSEYDIYNVTMKDSSNVDERNYVDNSTDRTYAKAAFLSLAADPANAANQVLKISSVTVGSAKLSTITFTPEELVAGGDVYVIEADMTMLGDFTNTGRPAIEFFLENKDDTVVKNITALYTGATKVGSYIENFRLGNAADSEAARFNAGEWGRAMIVCKDGAYKTYYSKDGGATWVFAKESTYNVEIDQLGFRFNVYNCNGTTLVDNVKCYKTDAVKLNIGGTVTDVFPAN